MSCLTSCIKEIFHNVPVRQRRQCSLVRREVRTRVIDRATLLNQAAATGLAGPAKRWPVPA